MCVARPSTGVDVQVAIWPWRIAPLLVSPVFNRSRLVAIRITSDAGNSVDVVRVRGDWSLSSHSPRACQT
jgi:hypothetical protein